MLLQEHWSHTVPASGKSEALRLLVDAGKQAHHFLEPSWREEGLCQGIHSSPNLSIGIQGGRHPER